MINKLKEQYDSLYSSNEVTFGGGRPIDSVIDLDKYIGSGTVLDIGGGEGRNAIYLSNKGYDVTVLDISEVGLGKIKKVSERIKTKVSDVVNDGIDGMYDIVVNSFVLHHMMEKDAKKVISDSMSHTNKGGVNIINTFSDDGGLYKRNIDSERFYPSEEVLKEIYYEWDIKELSTRYTTTFAKDKNGERMKNSAVSIIAIKKN